jgi:hypothetical protein
LTHTLHRVGKKESLEKDYVIYGLASNVEMLKGNEPLYVNTKQLLTTFMETCIRHNPVNAGCIYPSKNPYSKTFAKGNSWRDMRRDMLDYTETLAVYNNQGDVEKTLKALKEADTGLSVVVSGVFEKVYECCRGAGLTPHTVNMALGIRGNEGLLPRGKNLEIVTMCGHGLVSRYLVEDLAKRIVSGEMTCEEAAKRLGSNCVCGAFNTERAAELLGEMITEIRGAEVDEK